MPSRKKTRTRPRTVRYMKQRSNPTNSCIANFTLSKYYYVDMPTAGVTAPQDAALLAINMASPFQPLSVKSGTWTANDSNNEPNGLDSTIYTPYEHCKVLGSTVKVNVVDSPDNAGTSAQDGLTEGVVRLNRTTDSSTITAASDNATLRFFPNQKVKAVSFANTVNLSANLTKNAHLQIGYSPRKVWAQPARSNYNLKITNTTGSSNVPIDSTWAMLSIHCANDNVTNDTLKPFRVQLQVQYRILFMEFRPTNNIPRPIFQYYNRPYSARGYLKNVPSVKAVNYVIDSALKAAILGKGLRYGAARYRAIRN